MDALGESIPTVEDVWTSREGLDIAPPIPLGYYAEASSDPKAKAFIGRLDTKDFALLDRPRKTVPGFVDLQQLQAKGVSGEDNGAPEAASQKSLAPV